MADTEVLILGAGVTGLAAAGELQEHALLIEKESRPGGSVRSQCFDGGYWFDNVLHLLHFSDAGIQEKVSSLDDIFLSPCAPEAWVDTLEGTVRYPFQLHLGGLNPEARIRCVNDFAARCFNENDPEPIKGYRDFLLRCFGQAMCECFFFPYNEKLWKYPLELMSDSGGTWNIHRPDFKEVLRGAFDADKDYITYNSNAFYPRPPANASMRGMDFLSAALARKVQRLEKESTVMSIDPENKKVLVKQSSGVKEFTYASSCISTLPLPLLMKCCKQVPQSLLNDVHKLRANTVISLAYSIEGPRPLQAGHWRYFTDPGIPFTRLIFMTNFDPLNAPEQGWSLLVETTWPGDKPLPSNESLFTETETALYKLEYLNQEMKIIGRHQWIADPAYVIFTMENNRIVDDCKEFLFKSGIQTAGRYGNWAYSSMFQNIREGYAIAEKIRSSL